MKNEDVRIENKTLSVLEYSSDKTNIRIWAVFDPDCKMVNLLFVNTSERIIKTERVWIEHREELTDELVINRLKNFYRYKSKEDTSSND